MGRKGKAQKHTAKELNAKHKAAKEAKGAGNDVLSYIFFKLLNLSKLTTKYLTYLPFIYFNTF